MSGKKAHNSTRKYGKRLSILGGEITLRFEVNCIHDFRTTFKKLRALFRWLSPVKVPLTKSFTQVYHLTGELRNAQVLLKDTEIQKEGEPGKVAPVLPEKGQPDKRYSLYSFTPG